MNEEERQKIHDELREQYEYTFDMDKMKPITHRWVDRGEVMSCEGAGHDNHHAFKRK